MEFITIFADDNTAVSDNYSGNKFTIFNRWGDKINTITNYNNTSNNWTGKNSKGEVLPDGVYFYIVKIKDMETKTGWVYVRGKGDN